jgi:uncharacterized Fe-S cluster-containing MiaB family protein
MNSEEAKQLIEESYKEDGIQDIIFESEEEFIKTFGLDNITFVFPEHE